MQIFNTLTRQKEEFVPQVPGEYRIYVCGPTVYNNIHIGTARPLIVFDTLRRYLEYRGNKVFYVSNITDIDDKLIKKGQEEGTSMKEVAQRFEAEYLKDAAGLNCKKPTVQPRATELIQQILDIVKDLIDSGHAYVAKNGDVYFRVKSDPEYGKLSHLKLDDLESGNRELRSQMDDDLKEDPADFIRSLKTVQRVEVLPYHTLGLFKWQKLGIPYPLPDAVPPTAEQVKRAEELLEVSRYPG